MIDAFEIGLQLALPAGEVDGLAAMLAALAEGDAAAQATEAEFGLPRLEGLGAAIAEADRVADRGLAGEQAAGWDAEADRAGPAADSRGVGIAVERGAATRATFRALPVAAADRPSEAELHGGEARAPAVVAVLGGLRQPGGAGGAAAGGHARPSPPRTGLQVAVGASGSDVGGGASHAPDPSLLVEDLDDDEAAATGADGAAVPMVMARIVAHELARLPKVVARPEDRPSRRSARRSTVSEGGGAAPLPGALEHEGGAAPERAPAGGGVAMGGPRSLLLEQGAAPQAEGGGGEGERGGTVMLDGRLVGQWMSDWMAREASRPGAGVTSFDPRQAPGWTPSGVL